VSSMRLPVFAFGVLRGRWDGKYSEGTPGLWAGSLEIFKTTRAGDDDLAFTIGGPKSESIGGATLTVQSVGADGKPFTSRTVLAAAEFNVERTFVTNVDFSGDPVGSSHDVTIVVDEPDRRRNFRETATIHVIQLPGNDTAPGPILDVTQGGYGNRYTPPATQGQTQVL